MGNGIAHVFAQCGFKVSLIDVSAEVLKNGLNAISINLDRMVSKEKISLTEKNTTIENIKTFISLKEGVVDVDIVIEAATENSELKCKIFQELDQLCKPSAILATNTSSISITKIAAATSRTSEVDQSH